MEMNTTLSTTLAISLVAGKLLGISLFSWIGIKSGMAQLPKEVRFCQVIGVAMLAGVGFTMSIFISSAAFQGEQLQSVKLAVLLASLLAAILGTIVLMRASSAQEVK